MTPKITSGETWREEEAFFDAKRHDANLSIIEKKWSEGSSPIVLVKWGYVKLEEWEKCFWYRYSTARRCHECKWSKQCPNYKQE